MAGNLEENCISERERNMREREMQGNIAGKRKVEGLN